MERTILYKNARSWEMWKKAPARQDHSQQPQYFSCQDFIVVRAPTN